MYTLLLLLCGNILLFAWFVVRTRETSADEVIQKACVVSRLVSVSAARAMADDDLSSLDSAAAEALKDGHIASITLLDKGGRVILEKADVTATPRLHKFETPVHRGNETVGTLVTRFSLDDQGNRMIGRLRTTAAVQIGLFALIAAVMAIVCRRERLSPGAVTIETRCGYLLPLKGVTQAAEMALLKADDGVWQCLALPETSRLLARDHSDACISLGETLAVLAAGGAVADRVASLCRRMEEPAGRSRDIAPIYLLDRGGRVILEKDEATGASRPRSLETPVSHCNETAGTPATLGSLGELGGLSIRWRDLAAVRFGLFALMSAVPADVGRREALSPGAATIERSGPLLPAEGQKQAAEMVPVKAADEASRLLARDLYGACMALQEALAVLAGKAGLRRNAEEQAGQRLERFSLWQKHAATVAGHAASLVAAGHDTVETVREQCLSFADMGVTQVEAAQLLMQRLHDNVAPMQEAVAVVRRVGRELHGAALRDGGACAAAREPVGGTVAEELTEEIAGAIQGRAIPALAAALDVVDVVAGRVASLARLMEELDGRSREVARLSAALCDMPETTRSPGDNAGLVADPAVVEDAGFGEVDWERNLFAEELALSLKRSILALQGVAGEAATVSRSAIGEAREGKELMMQAGVAVEDAAAASILSAELLRKSGLAANKGSCAIDHASEAIAGLADALHGVQRPLADHVHDIATLADHAEELAGIGTKQRLQAEEYASSLAVAGETLRLAGLFLAGLAADSAQSGETSRETTSVPEGATPIEAVAAAENLIRGAHERLAHLLSFSFPKVDDGIKTGD